MSHSSKRPIWSIPVILGSAFVTSFIGDFFFETKWTNPWWYAFEASVWGTALLLLSPLFANFFDVGDRPEDSSPDNIQATTNNDS